MAEKDAKGGQEGVTSPEGEEDSDYGIPERNKVKRRPYTMTEAAKAQRKAAAASPNKSEGMKGNRNAWKTGEHAEGFVRQVFRPCKSTCPQFPCAIVEDGETEPGEICLDKKMFVQTLLAVQTALREGKLDDFKEVAALRIAGGMEVVQRLIDDILTDGTLVKSEKFGADGMLLGVEIKNHPSLFPLAKLFESLKLSPQDFMITPLMVKKHATEEKKAASLADMMSGFGKLIGGKDDDE